LKLCSKLYTELFSSSAQKLYARLCSKLYTTLHSKLYTRLCLKLTPCCEARRRDRIREANPY
jgi:hypothetical protein